MKDSDKHLKKHFKKLFDKALMMEHIPADETGNMAFMARILVLATMPHSKTDELVWMRRNGDFELRMVADPRYGLPYGSQARLILAWVTTQAIKTRCPVVDLGSTMSGFMKELGITPTGGRYGSIQRFKEQTQRLFTTGVTFTYDNADEGWMDKRYLLTEMTNLWWKPGQFEAVTKPSQVCLSPVFFDELSRHPVPFDLRALASLRKSPLAMDIYCWLTYRYHTLQNPTVISWESLMMQFGCNYASKHQFRQKFLLQLAKVKVLYPKANIEEIPKRGVKMWPSPTHITPIQ